LHGLFVNNTWCDNKEEVKNKVCEFFEERFARNDACQVRLDKVEFNSLSESDNEMLIGEFSEEEVRIAIWGCDSSKSPDPDGFNFGFIKSCWDIFERDVVAAVKDFADTGKWPRGSNASFLCLIPKVENPQQLGEFRPISLVGCLYKIISKALSLRLKKVIGKVIDARQSTFLEGRGLLDSVLVANEVLEEYKRKRKSCVFFKVDYEKSYDSVNWDFIFYMFKRLGFCERWIRWIKGCLESASVSVLVNGSPTREFFPRKGLCQGDPLAPFLFLIVAEGLAGVARVAEEKKLIDSLEVGKNKVKVNMLQYADDTLFLCEGNTKSVFNIKAILQCFELASGLRVNFVKSRIGGMGLDQVVLQQFAAILNCETMVAPFIYLGMPVGGCHKRGDFWNGVIEKVQARLSRWKGRCLTMAGRICLIKSVLSFIPLFFMSLFKLPSGVAKKLIRIQRNFLWGWGAKGRKIAWASWRMVCKPREYGGLGIIDLKLFNLALLGKWIWRLGSVEGGLWKEILFSKYEGWRSLGEEGKGRRCSLWWKDLKEVWSSEGWGRNFEDGFKWKVGHGKDIYFWKDSWLNGESLKNVFPRLFSTSFTKDAKLAELGFWSNDVWVWQLAWRRPFLSGRSRWWIS